jgi:proliferating cell nuclear antigen
MFKVVIEDTEKLKDVLASANTLFDEAIFELTPEGIKFLDSDRAGVVLIDLFMKKEMFKEYECDKPMKIAFNMQEFYRALSLFKSDATLSLEGDHTFVFSQSKPFRKIIKIRLFEPDAEKQEELKKMSMLKLQFSAVIELRGTALEDATKESDKFGASVLFDVDNNRLRFFGKGDITEYDYRIEKENPVIIKLEASVPCRTILNRDYLSRIMKAVPITENMRIEMGKDYPMRISFITENVILIYYVAPTVEETLEGRYTAEGKYGEEEKQKEIPIEEETKIISKTKKKIVLEG